MKSLNQTKERQYLSFLKVSCILLVSAIALINSINMYGQDVVINEIMSSNSHTISDEDGDFPDWIELYNSGTDTINLEGYGLSDDYFTPFRWVFPDVTLYPDGYLLVWASGKDRRPASGDWANGLLRQVYSGISGTNVDNLINHPNYPDNPDSEHLVTDYFEAPSDIGDNYGQRMHGYILAPQTGNYTFWIASDDNGRLFLSTDEMPGNAELIAEVPGWTPPREWEIYPEQESDLIFLEEGRYYYISALMKEGGGGDNLAVRWRLPDTTIEEPIPGSRLFWKDGELHTNFAISADGEEIILTNPSGTRIDEVAPIVVPTDISYGRYPNGSGEWLFYSEPTPGEANQDNGFNDFLASPVFSHDGGFYNSPFNLGITSTEPDVDIYYSLDGSVPHPDNVGGTSYEYKNDFPSPGDDLLNQSYHAHLYTNQINIINRSTEANKISMMASTYNQFYYPPDNIFKGTAVKARAFKTNSLPSETVTHTYFVTSEGRSRFSMPIIAINIQEDELFDYYKGIYVPGKILDDTGNPSPDGGTDGNYKQRGRAWERQATLEFFETGSTSPAFKQEVGVRLHGGWSRGMAPKKSLRLYARNDYGEPYFNHQVFPDQEHDAFKRLLLRNSGNDFDRALFRDAAIQAIMAGMKIDRQAFRPSIVFINGEYWGIHNIRERYDRHYLNRVYGVDPDNIDLLTNANTVKEGSSQHYDETLNYLQSNNVQQAAHYEYVKTRIDIENFIDYQIANIYANNRDWPGNNIDFWRNRTGNYEANAPYGHDGRWRWMLFDTDFGFSLYGENFHENTIQFATQAGGWGWPNPDWSTYLLRTLLQNATFRDAFINRFADLLNSNFKPQYVKDVIADIQQKFEPEIQEYMHRWGSPWSLGNWHNHINLMTEFADERPDYQRQHIRNRSQFGISGDVSLTINVSNAQHGHVRINTLDIKSGEPGIPENPHPWTGIYFRDIPIEFRAIPATGYAFSHWEGLAEETNAVTSQVFEENSASITAFFEKAELLHYWHFNSLTDGAITIIPTDHSLIGNAFITYPGTGDGYMDRVEDGTSLNALPGTSEGRALRVRNPSDSRELLIETPTTGYQNITLSFVTKRTANGAQAQLLYYRISPQENWIMHDGPVTITEDYEIISYQFSNPDVNNNPDFAVKIDFGGTNAAGTSGNNRFDNVRMDGIPFIPVNVPIARDNGLNNYPDPKIYFAKGQLHVYNPYPGKVRVTVYDVQGMAVQILQVPPNGQYGFAFNPKTGIYIARMIHEQKLFTTKFLVNE